VQFGAGPEDFKLLAHGFFSFQTTAGDTITAQTSSIKVVRHR
jgi:hypothetical protein